MDRTKRRSELYALLGELPPRDRPVGGEVISREEREGYVLETLTLDLNDSEPVPRADPSAAAKLHRKAAFFEGMAEASAAQGLVAVLLAPVLIGIVEVGARLPVRS